MHAGWRYRLGWRAPRVPVVRVTRGQPRSLMSPSGEYPHVSLIQLRAMIAARSSKLAMWFAEVSVRRLHRRTSAGDPPWAWPQPSEQLLLLCRVSLVLCFLLVGWARERVLSNGRPTGSNAFPCGALPDRSAVLCLRRRPELYRLAEPTECSRAPQSMEWPEVGVAASLGRRPFLRFPRLHLPFRDSGSRSGRCSGNWVG